MCWARHRGPKTPKKEQLTKTLIVRLFGFVVPNIRKVQAPLTTPLFYSPRTFGLLLTFLIISLNWNQMVEEYCSWWLGRMVRRCIWEPFGKSLSTSTLLALIRTLWWRSTSTWTKIRSWELYCESWIFAIYLWNRKKTTSLCPRFPVLKRHSIPKSPKFLKWEKGLIIVFAMHLHKSVLYICELSKLISFFKIFLPWSHLQGVLTGPAHKSSMYWTGSTQQQKK